MGLFSTSSGLSYNKLGKVSPKLTKHLLYEKSVTTFLPSISSGHFSTHLFTIYIVVIFTFTLSRKSPNNIFKILGIASFVLF